MNNLWDCIKLRIIKYKSINLLGSIIIIDYMLISLKGVKVGKYMICNREN